MRPPRSEAARRSRQQHVRKRLKLLGTLLLAFVMWDDVDELDKPKKLVSRDRRTWETYIRPMLDDGTFRKRFRMDYEDFMTLANMLRPQLQRDNRMGGLRNGTIPVEFQIAMALRFLAGGSIYEVMDGHVIARSTAYHIVHRVIDALNQSNELECHWPLGEEVEGHALLFRRRSTNSVITRAVGAMDGLFIRITKPTVKSHRCANSFYSGHKKGYGMNFQAICNARYEIIAWTMNCPGSQNDRTAFKHSGFSKLLRTLPDGFYIVGDAAYPPSDQVLVPYPGTKLSPSQDSYNFYQSQCRISIEQTFGIMVRTWGVLWRPCEIKITRFVPLVTSIVRLHNFLRRRRSHVPPSFGVTRPEEVQFTKDGHLKGDYFNTSPTLGRRPKDGSKSGPRENIRARLEAQAITRPRFNLLRNKKQ